VVDKKVEDTKFDTPKGHIKGNISYFGMSTDVKLIINRMLFLDDGLHLYVSFE
jgi:hypothetical protein